MIQTTSRWLFRSNNFLLLLQWLAIILGLPAYLHKDLKIFVKDVCHLREHSGTKYTVQILKESSRILAKYLAGEPVKSAEIIGCGISKLGIPTILPTSFRKEIESGSIVVIRFSLSMLSFYRAMHQSPELKIDTIESKSKTDLSPMVASFAAFLPHGVRWFIAEGRFIPKLGKPNFQFIFSAGPNGQATIGSGYDALAIMLKMPSILKFGWTIGSRYALIHIIFLALVYGFYVLSTAFFQSHPALHLGRLALKEEAAGKVRVFAIVDYWTQSFLRPVHHWAFKILEQIPQDGTFDHRRKAKEVGEILLETGKPAYSLDLSAATDRFPVRIQEEILKYLLGESLGTQWKHILVDREFFFKKEDRNVKYAVGQPMGALSSWAVFALSHHFVVQWAHYRTGGKSWFQDYAIIGDDVVILDTRVAEQYLVILDQLGVGVSMHKSLTSKTGVFEFAKQIHYKGLNLSPLNPNETIKAYRDDCFMVQWIEDLEQREFSPDFIQVAKSSIRYQKGVVNPYRKIGTLPFWSRRILVALTSPFGPFPVNANYWININSYSIIDLSSNLISRNRFKSKFAGDSRIANACLKLVTTEWDQYLSHTVQSMIRRLDKASQLTLGVLRGSWLEKWLGRIYLIFGTPFPLVIMSTDVKGSIFTPKLARARFGYVSPDWTQSLFDLSFPSSEMKEAYRGFKRSIDLHRFTRQIAYSFPNVSKYSVEQGFGHLNPVMGGPLTPFGEGWPLNDDARNLIEFEDFLKSLRSFRISYPNLYGYGILLISVVPSLALIGVCLTL